MMISKASTTTNKRYLDELQLTLVSTWRKEEPSPLRWSQLSVSNWAIETTGSTRYVTSRKKNMWLAHIFCGVCESACSDNFNRNIKTTKFNMMRKIGQKLIMRTRWSALEPPFPRHSKLKSNCKRRSAWRKLPNGSGKSKPNSMTPIIYRKIEIKVLKTL